MKPIRHEPQKIMKPIRREFFQQEFLGKEKMIKELFHKQSNIIEIQ